MTNTTLLRKALAAHGGDKGTFAAEVLGRSKSSVYRWLNGDPIPKTVLARLRAYLTSPTE